MKDMLALPQDLVEDFGLIGAIGVAWLMMLIPLLASLLVMIVAVRLIAGPFGPDGHPVIALYVVVMWHSFWIGWCSGLRRVTS